MRCETCKNEQKMKEKHNKYKRKVCRVCPCAFLYGKYWELSMFFLWLGCSEKTRTGPFFSQIRGKMRANICYISDSAKVL